MEANNQSNIYVPGIGESISQSCKAAVAQAREINAPVSFTFNDMEMRAQPDSTPEGLVDDWNRRMEAARKAWQESPEGIAYEQNRLAEIAKAQAKVNELEEKLNSVLLDQGMDELMEWVAEFTSNTDWVGVTFDKEFVIGAFEHVGFKENWHVGKPPEWFDTRQKLGQYIVGQMLDGYKNHGCVPQIIAYWCQEKYLELTP